MANALSELLRLPPEEQEELGVVHTPKEIAQQPLTWHATFSRFSGRQLEIREFLRSAGIGVHGATRPTVFLVGAGTSDYVGRALADLLRQRWQCEVLAVPSTDLLVNMEGLMLPGQPYLWISFSRSGDSSEGVAAIEVALQRYPEIRHLVVTCNKNGRMAEICANRHNFALVLDDAVNDRGLAMTSSFSNMVVAGHCLAHVESLPEYEGLLTELTSMGNAFLPVGAETASEIAGQGCSKACFVGSASLRAVAKESALKLLELTAGRVNAMSESTLGLRHGPMSSLDDDTLVVSFLSTDPLRSRYELDLLREISDKGLGRIRVAVSPTHDSALDGLVNHNLVLNAPKNFPDQYRVPVDIIFAQLLGLFSSLRAGLKPDCPSPNGAISRVVSHISIYS